MIFRSDYDCQNERHEPPTRNAMARAAFERHRREVVEDSSSSVLAKVRVQAFSHGYTREELAERAGVSVSTIAKAESDPHRVGDDVWAALAGALTQSNGRNYGTRWVVSTFRTINPSAIHGA